MKRFFATAGAVFERFVDQVENHEAVAESLIREVTTCAAQLKVQGKRLDSQISRLTEDRATQERVRDRWRERAVKLAREDEARALECVRRMRAAERLVQGLTRQLEEEQALRDQIARDLEKVEARLRSLRLRKVGLSARGARSKALGGRVSADPAMVEGLFDRWEAQVVRDEYRAEEVDDAPSADAFEQALDASEDEAELRAMLSEMTGEV